MTCFCFPNRYNLSNIHVRIIKVRRNLAKYMIIFSLVFEIFVQCTVKNSYTVVAF